MVAIYRIVKVSDFFTLGNLCCGLLAIFSCIDHQPQRAAWLILLAMLLDSLDGKVASWMHEKNELGKQLDSLADLVSFGIAPAVAYYTLVDHNGWTPLPLLFFVSCGMLRLARYNVSSNEGFEGVPITVNGIIFPMLLLVPSFWTASLTLWPVLFVILGGLMISSLKVNRLF